MTAWNAFYAPRDTPQPIVDLLNKELAKALAEPETKKRLLELGFDPAGGTPAELTQFEKQERLKWGSADQGDGSAGRLSRADVSQRCPS